MKYLAAIPIVLLFVALDIILLVSMLGICIVAEDGQYPLSYRFALRVFD